MLTPQEVFKSVLNSFRLIRCQERRSRSRRPSRTAAIPFLRDRSDSRGCAETRPRARGNLAVRSLPRQGFPTGNTLGRVSRGHVTNYVLATQIRLRTVWGTASGCCYYPFSCDCTVKAQACWETNHSIEEYLRM